MRRTWGDVIFDATVWGGIIGLIVAAVFGVVVGITAIVNKVETDQCRRIGTQSSYETKYVGGTWWSRECYVRQDDGRWVPLDKWRGIDE